MLPNHKKKGKSTWAFENQPCILSSSAVVGPMEGEGKLTDSYDRIYDDLYVGQETWEKAERQMLSDATEFAIQKASLQDSDISFYIAGDLLNQNISASFSAKEKHIPFIGIYGACSSSMLSLALGASLVDGGFGKYVLIGVSSHNCTVEKQYRYPTEYGGQKPDTSQWTVTGAGASVIGFDHRSPKITYATIGQVEDLGITNPLDMGSAMAPAAAKTIQHHFEDTGRKPSDYDLIVTGDLSKVGHPIAREMLEKEGYPMGESFSDCGLMIYNADQETFAGGSGCACSAVVTFGHLLKEMKKGTLRKILVVATGALLSPTSYQQGESIPCIAHAVAIEL
jgi:stage V sporulation protein AD